jgi:cytochrome c-type biogenesis protein CcmE
MKVRIAVGVFVIAGVIGYVAYLGASSSWRYYFVVDELVGQAERIGNARLRVSGCVAGGSLTISENRRNATFVLRGSQSELPVVASGAMPDNLAEGMEIVVEGNLQGDGRIHADRVITRCASKYAPKHESTESPRDARPNP